MAEELTAFVFCFNRSKVYKLHEAKSAPTALPGVGPGGGETTRPTGEGYANMQSGGGIDSHGALREPPGINGYREETCIAERQL